MPGPDKGAVCFDSCLRLRIEPGWVKEPHGHGHCHELTLVVRGALNTAIAGRAIAGKAGSVLLYPRSLTHAPATEGDEALEMVVLRWAGGEHLARLTEPGVWHDRKERIRHQLDWLLELHPSGRMADRGAVDALTHTVVHELGRLQDPAPGDLATRIRAFVRANLQRRLTLDDLAAVAGLSKYHFTRRLRQATGQSPMRVVNQIRIEVAQSLLLQTRLTLDAIAAQVGLADASHLSHLFRRLMGRSPGSIRRLG